MGFLNPLYLLFCLSIGVLILIYLSARSRSTVEVSSLLLFAASQISVSKARVLKLDSLFWLEAAALAALALGLAGLYMKMAPIPTGHRRHALVFDLAAGMGARKGSRSRLDEARSEALSMVASAAPGERFAVVSFSSQAQVERYFTADLAAVRSTIEALRPYDVATQPAALAAALMRVRDADVIDLYAPRLPPGAASLERLDSARLHYHQVGVDEQNAAVTGLDPGIPRVSPGHCTIRNMSTSPVLAQVQISLNGHGVDGGSMILSPHAQANIKFGPLPTGGVVQALIGTPDALAADNSRYAYAAGSRSLKAAVISPDAAVRDDLARVLRAVDPGSRVVAGTADQLTSAIIAKSLGGVGQPDIAVIHDSAAAAVRAGAKLFIFSPTGGEFPVKATLPVSQMDDRTDLGPLTRPLLLGPTRSVGLPEWMDPLAHGTAPHRSGVLTLAAYGISAQGPEGMIAFDIRGHRLMDPDMLDTLVLAIDLVKTLTGPRDVHIVPTGTYVTLPANAPATVVEPDGSTAQVAPGYGGLIRYQPLYAGRYQIAIGPRRESVYANYFDAAESELSVTPAPESGAPLSKVIDLDSGVRARRIQPLTMALVALAMAAFLVESAMLIRRALRGGASLV
ncbi:MAG TPA: VWA domain-containing protein [Candidatus Binataceae bacterium]|nr:VWA domain-containing protein [Candidatus Binataceae bacterium]